MLSIIIFGVSLILSRITSIVANRYKYILFVPTPRTSSVEKHDQEEQDEIGIVQKVQTTIDLSVQQVVILKMLQIQY